jgi:hypothetical protein
MRTFVLEWKQQLLSFCFAVVDGEERVNVVLFVDRHVKGKKREPNKRLDDVI